jgi:hypothetical protein
MKLLHWLFGAPIPPPAVGETWWLHRNPFMPATILEVRGGHVRYRFGTALEGTDAIARFTSRSQITPAWHCRPKP